MFGCMSNYELGILKGGNEDFANLRSLAASKLKMQEVAEKCQLRMKASEECMEISEVDRRLLKFLSKGCKI